MEELTFDIKQAQDFLYNFDENLNITFQLFDDTKVSQSALRYTGHFTNNLTNPDCIQYLIDANKAGCGVYFMVNEGDGKGRSEHNVTSLRCLAIDLDGAPLEPVLNCPVVPHYVIESSRGRYQCYWLIEPVAIKDFESFDVAKQSFATWQIALARLFHADESIRDLPRVLRVPSFYHRKDSPYKVQVLQDNSGLPYSLQFLIDSLGLKEKIQSIQSELKKPLESISLELKIKQGERHLTLLRYACKYAHLYRLSEDERWFLLQGLNRTACPTPISEFPDLKRINMQATRYAEEQKQELEQVNITALLEKHKSVAKNPTELIPEFLFKPAGLVGRVMDYMLSCSIKPQPEHCLGAAFAACGALFGRKIRSETNLRTNVYFLSLIETGGGKDWPRQAIKKLFHAAGATNKASVESVTSDSAIVNSIAACPSQVLLFDEFGKLMQTAMSKSAGSHEVGIPTMLMKLFSSANTTFNAKTYADEKMSKVIEQPNACLLGTSVESNFYKSITKEAVDDGLLNRIILMKSANPDPAMHDIQNFDPPEDLVKEFILWESVPYNRSGGNLADVENSSVTPPDPMIVPFAEGAKEIFQEMERDLRAFREDLRKEGFAGLFTRCYENSLKIALILAAGQNRVRPEISVADAEYATTLVLVTTKILLQEVRKKVSDSKVEANYKNVLLTIRDAGLNGICQKELGQKLRKFGIDKRLRDEILKELESMGQIYPDVDKSTSKRGTVSYKFIRD